MPSTEKRPSITEPYTTSTPPIPAPLTTASTLRQTPISRWRQIFPRYAFEQPNRHLTPEHPPGVPSVTTPSTRHPTPPTPNGDSSQPQPNALDAARIIAPLDRTDEPEALHRNRVFLYRAAIGTCVAIPVIALVPPRKLDLFTLGLGVTFFLTAGFAVEQKTGKGLMWHIGRSIPTLRNRERWKERRLERLGINKDSSAAGGLEEEEEEEEEEKAHTAKSKDWEDVWKKGSNSKDAWIIEREAKERRVFEEGEGYGTLIMDQIREVFGLKNEDDDEDDRD